MTFKTAIPSLVNDRIYMHLRCTSKTSGSGLWLTTNTSTWDYI